MSEKECLITPQAVNKFVALSIKNCGDIFTEISKYQPREIIETDLDERWRAELYNRDCFIRLYDLFQNKSPWPVGCGEDIKAKEAIRLKMIQFKKKIVSNQKSFASLALDFSKFKFGEITETIGWDD